MPCRGQVNSCYKWEMTNAITGDHAMLLSGRVPAATLMLLDSKVIVIFKLNKQIAFIAQHIQN